MALKSQPGQGLVIAAVESSHELVLACHTMLPRQCMPKLSYLGYDPGTTSILEPSFGALWLRGRQLLWRDAIHLLVPQCLGNCLKPSSQLLRFQIGTDDISTPWPRIHSAVKD